MKQWKILGTVELQDSLTQRNTAIFIRLVCWVDLEYDSDR